ncbi:MAG: hypothetical protein AUJ34_03380 [Parcubacteria group bacterium CG1_02_41_12]|nr:MAG: hypothetical protein AUJ34_03380 [Parcubacteria group bacterium CG1_02_41_12]PIP66786.1 MAG: hypothetical protein COW93_03750 [Parcubacteria group bacterium CG22_combo_CG10-13_8_21_14_all_41_9]PIQ80505.1 MAG: hypothetical protein COV79_00105 [Parcubacteria group bacterium CG11_big_fil_rev_8_21_14_0_20_41_14]
MTLKFYFRVLGMKMDFSEVLIPEYKPGFDRILIIAHGLLISQALEACKFMHWYYWDDPDSAITVDERSRGSLPLIFFLVPFSNPLVCFRQGDFLVVDKKGLTNKNISVK